MKKEWERYQILAGLFALLWMIMIFGFSAQPSDDSGELSEGLSYQLVTVCDKMFGLDFDMQQIMDWTRKIEGPLRKLAHMTEYGILTVFIYLWLDYFCLNIRLQTGISLLCSWIYGASDEFHQRFVPGRSGSIRDVCIDGAGAVIGIVLFMGVRKCINSLWKHRQYKKIES